MNNVKKILQRYHQFRSHPLTRENPVEALGRYIIFNIKSRFRHEQIISWVGGLKFYARKGDAGLVSNIYHGLYEFEESIFLLHFLNEDDLFLDIGANLGHFSLLLSGVKNCRSIAVEPVPKTYRQLCRNIQLNSLQHLVKPFNIGISDSEDNLFFSTDRNTMDRVVDASYASPVRVKVTSIDQLLENETPVAIKLDVEGYEYFVLKGAERILSCEKLKVVIIELNNSGKKYGISDEKTVRLIMDKGFDPYFYRPETRSLTKLNSYNEKAFNTIFIRNNIQVQDEA